MLKSNKQQQLHYNIKYTMIFVVSFCFRRAHPESNFKKNTVFYQSKFASTCFVLCLQGWWKC